MSEKKEKTPEQKKKGKKKMWIILGAVALFLLLQWLFIGYRFSFGPFKGLGDIRMAKLPGNAESYGMDKLEALPDSPLQGKKALFLGSSVTYGAASLQEGIPEYFKVRLACEITKEAVSGTTLTDDSGNTGHISDAAIDVCLVHAVLNYQVRFCIHVLSAADDT